LAQVVARFNEMTIGMQERQKLERFVSEEATRTIENEILLQREHAGERMRAAIVFVHIRGFDELCETLDPDQLIACLNLYFAAMEPIIRQNHGVIDKYIGDAIMVVFADSEAGPAVLSANACAAALAMLDCQAELALQLRAENLPRIEIGVGVAIGEVIRGKIGAELGRKDFTVIGDVVNLAARLESLSRNQPTPSAMVSADIASECRFAFSFEKCGETAIKGKKDKQLVYRLIGVAHG
jgi:adenylate cyclase